jgi:hypothetical protein
VQGRWARKNVPDGTTTRKRRRLRRASLAHDQSDDDRATARAAFTAAEDAFLVASQSVGARTAAAAATAKVQRLAAAERRPPPPAAVEASFANPPRPEVLAAWGSSYFGGRPRASPGLEVCAICHFRGHHDLCGASGIAKCSRGLIDFALNTDDLTRNQLHAGPRRPPSLAFFSPGGAAAPGSGFSAFGTFPSISRSVVTLSARVVDAETLERDSAFARRNPSAFPGGHWQRLLHRSLAVYTEAQRLLAGVYGVNDPSAVRLQLSVNRIRALLPAD